MEPNLPQLPGTADWYDKHLNVKLYDLFRRIRPASGWKDLKGSLNSAKVTGASQPSWSVVTDSIYAYEFSASQMNEAWLTFHLTHDLSYGYVKEDGTISHPHLFPHIHWASSGTDTGTARLGFEWTYAAGFAAGVFGASSTVYIEQAATGVALTHMIAETPEADAINSANFETDGLVLCRIFRDGAHVNDTLTDTIYIFEADLHYYSDGLQTNERDRSTGDLPWTKQSTL